MQEFFGSAKSLLELGALGLGGLVFLLTFFLLYRRLDPRDGNEAEPRERRDLGSFDRLVRTFMTLGVVSYVFAAAVEIAGWIFDPDYEIAYNLSPNFDEVGLTPIQVRRADREDLMKGGRRYPIDDDIILHIVADRTINEVRRTAAQRDALVATSASQTEVIDRLAEATATSLREGGGSPETVRQVEAIESAQAAARQDIQAGNLGAFQRNIQRSLIVARAIER